LRWLQASLVLQPPPVPRQQLEPQQVLQVPRQEVLLVELQVVPAVQLAAHHLLQVQTQRRIDQKAWILKKKMVTMK
jgi:hypothetical protein